MCVEGFFCPAGSSWEGVSQTCVLTEDCPAGDPTLPGGIAAGRPFTVSDIGAPVMALLVEAASDWGEL
jgi:hypothetical protein